MKLARLLLLFPLTFVVCVAQAEESSHYTIAKQRNQDDVTVEKEGGVTIYSIRSSNGIGWAKFENDRAWPMKAIVRLQYQGDRAWEHLENFTISSGRASISTSLKGGFEVRPVSEEGRAALAGLTPAELREKVGLQLQQRGKTIEIDLPMNWLAEESEFMVRWIDVYRN